MEKSINKFLLVVLCLAFIPSLQGFAFKIPKLHVPTTHSVPKTIIKQQASHIILEKIEKEAALTKEAGGAVEQTRNLDNYPREEIKKAEKGTHDNNILLDVAGNLTDQGDNTSEPFWKSKGFIIACFIVGCICLGCWLRD